MNSADGTHVISVSPSHRVRYVALVAQSKDLAVASVALVLQGRGLFTVVVAVAIDIDVDVSVKHRTVPTNTKVKNSMDTQT